MKKIADCVPNVVNKLNEGEMKSFYSFYRSWTKIVGSDLAKYTRVKDLIKGVAIIEVDHSPGMTVVEMEKDKILKRLQSAYAELDIEKISIVLRKERQIKIETKIMPRINEELLKKETINDDEFKNIINRFNNMGD